MVNNLEFEYPLPKRISPGTDTFKLSAQSLSEWRDGLPTGDPEATARMLLEGLYQANRLQASNEERINFLQTAARIAGPVFESLHRKLVNAAAPPKPKEMELAERAIGLHQELALAYRATLVCRQDEQQQSSTCLLLHEQEHAAPKRLLMSPSCLPKGSVVTLKFRGEELETTLQKEIQRTLGYVEYRCGPPIEALELSDTDPRFQGEADTALFEPTEQAEQRPWKAFR